MREFLLRCPACGRRFAVRLQRKKLGGCRRGCRTKIMHDVVVVARGFRESRVIPDGSRFEQVPIERETFDLTYKCRNCQHEWSETVRTVEKIR